MESYRQIIQSARSGQIIPIVKQIELQEPVDFFAKLSDYGRAKNCCLFESKEHLAENALSFGTARPALYLTGKENNFLIQALSKTGRRMLEYLGTTARQRFEFCESVEFGTDEISGQIKRSNKLVDEQSRQAGRPAVRNELYRGQDLRDHPAASNHWPYRGVHCQRNL